MSASVAMALRALVADIRDDRDGGVDEYLIVDEVLKRLPNLAAQLEADEHNAELNRLLKEHGN